MNAVQPTMCDDDAHYIHWKNWDPNDFGTFTRADGVQFAAELRRAGVNLTARMRILEIGFGNGAFAGWARQFTKGYVGVEVNNELVNRAVKDGVEAYSTINDAVSTAAGRGYDLIVAFDVFEHLDVNQVIATLKQCRSSLTRDGAIVIRVPSGDSPFAARLINGDITHKTLLGSKAIGQIALLTGLELVSTHDTALPILGLGIKKVPGRCLVKAARAAVSLFIRAAFYGNKHAVMTSNMIAVLRSRQP